MTQPPISQSGSLGYGSDSPIQRAFSWIQSFFQSNPRPDIDTDAAQFNGSLIGNHLLHLLRGCGLLNGTGFHSVAVTLLRPMEDALDCFAAVILVKGAAERWQASDLKASDAAKLWTPLITDMLPKRLSLSEYRKHLRGDFNSYSHCSRDLCLWNLYFMPSSKDEASGRLIGTLQLNTTPYIIDLNGHSIDAYETAHLIEFIAIIKRAYTHVLTIQQAIESELSEIEEGVSTIMQTHDEHRCQEVRTPPEIARLDR